ncbi:hypothetical protein ACROYT_G017173 [Oculina patagonica]
MSVDRDVDMARIIDGHYDNLRKLLREIEFITSTNVDEDRRKRFSDDEAKQSQVVCPEVYKGSIHGYPFHRKGFETEECSVKQDIKDLVTLIFDDVVVTVCDDLPGPFLAKTSVLRDIGFHLSGEHGLFRELFLRVKDRYSRLHLGLDHGGTAVVTCPDVMFQIQTPPVRDDELANFANKHNIKKIVEPDGKTRWFGCRRGIKHRNGEKCPLKSGLVVPPCCLENIADAIKFVLEQCTRNNITCELQEGTLLGAVKLNKVLPWERDADITFLTADFPKLVKIKDVFNRQGYVVHDIQQPWCCVEGHKAGGKIELLANGWSIQMYGQHRMSSRRTLTNEHPPTKVFFSGSWLNVPFNPGLYVRNRYGKEVYKHAEHWLSTGKQSGWDPYETGVFSSCPVKGFHGCLDQYQPDGSLQFENNF